MTFYDFFIWLKDFSRIFGLVLGYVFFYTLWKYYKHLSLTSTRKFPKAKKNHKYAIMIAARNEETVIGNLIDSINNQDYPKELVDIFVVADNCTDKTAEISRKYGAICYERFDSEHRTKGYALEFLVDNIEKDYGTQSYDAFFIFDADNLLKKDYITRMNEAFDSGEKIVTSYRNTKNFSDNWIAATYGIHWLRTVRNEHRARSVLGLATRIQGTGFMFSSEIIKDGWHYVSFTEDRAFSADAVVNGYRISYCDEAEFYDEQPTSLKIAMRQRIRWGKGHLQAFVESGPKLFWHIFVPKKTKIEYPPLDERHDNLSHVDSSIPDIHKDLYASLEQLVLYDFKNPFLNVLSWIPRLILIPFFALLTFCFYIINLILKLYGKIICFLKKRKFIKGIKKSKIFQNLKMRYMSYDMLLITFPNNLKTLIRRFLYLIAKIGLVVVMGNFMSKYYEPFYAYFTWFLLPTIIKQLKTVVYVFFIERKRIIKMPLYKKIFYSLMWPIFDIIGSIAVLIALFSHVEWKPIPHKSNVNMDELTKELAGKK